MNCGGLIEGRFLSANYLTQKLENISIAISCFWTFKNRNFYPLDCFLMFIVGELADGFGLWSEETPSTMLNCNTCKGVRREPWLQSRNETSNRR